MPLKSGKPTPKERAFAKAYGRTGDAVYAAEKAGYRNPVEAAGDLRKRDVVMQMSREETLRLLHEDVPCFAVEGLMNLARDPRMPGGTRARCFETLGKWSGLNATDGAPEKPDSELTGPEIRQRLAKLQAQTAVLEHKQAKLARPLIEHDAIPVDGSAFDQTQPNLA